MQNSSASKVSIITVCFNSRGTIRETIESVLSQTYPNIEYIIVDGVSNDGTQDVIKSYRDQVSKYISEPDNGLYDAMNKGIALATGDVVGILNSDDYYYDSNSVNDLVETMIEAGTDSVFADLIYFDPEHRNRVTRYYKSGPWAPWMLRFGKMPAHPTFFIKKKYYDELGAYSLNYKIASDYEFLVRAFHKASISFTYLPRAVVKMRAGGVSTRGLKSSIILNKEIVEACRENDVWTIIPLVLMKIPFKIAEVLMYKFTNLFTS